MSLRGLFLSIPFALLLTCPVRAQEELPTPVEMAKATVELMQKIQELRQVEQPTDAQKAERKEAEGLMTEFVAGFDRDPPITLVLEGRPHVVAANQFVDGDMAQRVMLRFMMEHGAPHDRTDWRPRAPYEAPMPVSETSERAEADGEWELETHPESSASGSKYTVSLQRDGHRVIGHMVGSGGNAMKLVGAISGTTLRWRATFGDHDAFPTDVSATVEGDSIVGEVTARDRSAVRFSGHKRRP